MANNAASVPEAMAETTNSITTAKIKELSIVTLGLGLQTLVQMVQIDYAHTNYWAVEMVAHNPVPDRQILFV
jgi:hypothetical protein